MLLREICERPFDSTEAAQGDEWARDRSREIAYTSLLFTNLKWTREHTTTHSTQEGHAGRCEHAEELARADAHRKRAGDTDFSTVLEREAGYVCAAEG